MRIVQKADGKGPHPAGIDTSWASGRHWAVYVLFSLTAPATRSMPTYKPSPELEMIISESRSYVRAW
jgi:hypothetical protein